jgi:hypothetical protein
MDMAYHRPSKREREERKKSAPGQNSPKITKSDRLLAGNGFTLRVESCRQKAYQ